MNGYQQAVPNVLPKEGQATFRVSCSSQRYEYETGGADMAQEERPSTVSPIEASTLVAAHRRDHLHADADNCHPHAAEVVHLGDRAAMVCHDCGTDSGFIAHRDAERLAAIHRHDTGGHPNGHTSRETGPAGNAA